MDKTEVVDEFETTSELYQNHFASNHNAKYRTRYYVHNHFDDSINSDLPCSNGHLDSEKEYVEVEHAVLTSLPLVGLQMWKGALVLGEYFLNNPDLVNNYIGLELGCGLGLTSLMFIKNSKRCYMTDYHNEILENCLLNININHHWIPTDHQVIVKQLDLMDTFPNFSSNSFSFTLEEVEELRNVNLMLFASDIFYDDVLTFRFFEVLEALFLSERIRCIISIEKRINFSVKYMRPVCENYEYFKSFLDEEGTKGSNMFIGTRIVPGQYKYFLNYERNDDVEIWEIKKKELLKEQLYT